MSASTVPASLKLTVLVVIMSEHIISFLMPTIVVYMVERLGGYKASNPNEIQIVSFWVGLLEGTNRLFALFGGIAWGMISDRIGRKKSLTIILIGISISSLGVGLSTSLYSVFCWRVVAGFLAGTIPIMKALMRDVSDDSNLSVLYSYFGTGYGAASILGPLFGGLLSNPGFFDDFLYLSWFFSIFPYFLPFLLHSCFTILAVGMVLKFIPAKATGQSTAPKKYSFLKEKDFLVSTLIFIMIAIVQFSYRAIVALWLRLDPSQGGIGWDSEVQPGLMNSLSGFVVMFFPLMLTDKLQQRFGVRKACWLVAALLMIPHVFLTFASLFDGLLMWSWLVVMNGLSVAFVTIMVSIISIAVSNSVLSNVAGTAIGITQAVVSFSRAIGNGGSAIIFGYLQKENFGFPFDFHLLFFTNCVILVLVIVMINCHLDENIEKRKKQEIEIPLLVKSS